MLTADYTCCRYAADTVNLLLITPVVDMQQALLDPGPDLVICDEGHRIKNSHAGISKSLKQINTK